MASTISGNVGLPNVVVSYFSEATDRLGFTTSDVSGNYTLSALHNNDTYSVSPGLTGYGFSPSLTSVVVGANQTITGKNFTPTLNTDVVPRIQLGADSFVQPDGLLSASWTNYVNAQFGQLAVTSNEVSIGFATPQLQNAAAYFTALQWPPNPYLVVQVDKMINDATVILILRDQDGTLTYSYQLYVDGYGVSTTTIFRISYYVTPPDGSDAVPLFRNNDIAGNPGDTFSVAILGNKHYFYHNTDLLGVATDSTYSSGKFGGMYISDNLITDSQVSHFVMGETALSAYSVPDDRNFGQFPNNSVNVQGTLTYTVPAHPSVTPPVDSRTVVPADSRIAAIIPQNSRTPGTFGPGE